MMAIKKPVLWAEAIGQARRSHVFDASGSMETAGAA
jgi:hypothetical protein